jgi:hypothetical protein
MVLATVAAATLLGGPLRAEISFVTGYRADAFSQSGNGPTLSDAGSFFASNLFSVDAGDYFFAEMTYPGPGSPAAMPAAGSTVFAYGSPLYPSQADMDADFPTGTYVFEAFGIGPSDFASFDYLEDKYPESLPYLTGTKYSDLQGMIPTQSFEFTFSPFTPGSGVTESFVFFTVFSVSANAIVFDGGFMPSTTTSLTMPANTLTPEEAYIYELIFSNRVSVPSPGAVFNALLGFDYRTTGRFVTGVPEAGSMTLAGLAAGVGAMVLGRILAHRSRLGNVASTKPA